MAVWPGARTGHHKGDRLAGVAGAAAQGPGDVVMARDAEQQAGHKVAQNGHDLWGADRAQTGYGSGVTV
jgi:hypothetical protein